MSEKKFFSITEFAQYSRISRDTLLFYDKIGLLKPAARKENNYRQYASGQLGVVNVIRTLQDLGMSLSEIKELKDRRTPLLVKEVLTDQIERIDAKIDDWIRARKLLLVFTETIDAALGIDEEEMAIRQLPPAAIVLGAINDYSGGRTDFDALTVFYQDIKRKTPTLDLNYPAWGMYSEERINRQDWRWPDRYYFSNPEGFDKIPGAVYAIGYARGGYGKNDRLFRRLLAFIGDSGYKIAGPAYEEYPLNEISVTDDNNYLMRVMITVRKINDT